MTYSINAGTKIQAIARGLHALGASRAATAAASWWNAGGCPNSVWADVWTAKGAASYAASKVGNVNGTILAEGNGAVTWSTAVGWSVLSGKNFFDTGITPANGYSLIVQFANKTAGTSGTLIGEYTDNARLWVTTTNTGNNYASGGYSATIAPQQISGNIAVTSQYGFRDGTSETAAISAWTAGAARTLYIFQLHHTPANPNYNQFYGEIVAAGVAKSSITAYIPALKLAMAAL